MQKSILLPELEGYLNLLLKPEMFNEKAYNGVQVTTKAEVRKIATAVSVSKEVIRKVVEAKANVLVVHHGIFCKGDAHPLVGRLYDQIEQLIINNIALLCYHLPLDAHQEVGNNWKAAQDLGLKNCTSCVEYAGVPIGVVGEINEISFDEFKRKVECYYGGTAAFIKIHDSVKKVAIVSGGADRFVKEAALAGADCFITGRSDEPVWDDAHDFGISFLGLGHYRTETVGPRALAKNIEEHFGISTVFINVENPF